MRSKFDTQAADAGSCKLFQRLQETVSKKIQKLRRDRVTIQSIRDVLDDRRQVLLISQKQKSRGQVTKSRFGLLTKSAIHFVNVPVIGLSGSACSADLLSNFCKLRDFYVFRIDCAMKWCKLPFYYIFTKLVRWTVCISKVRRTNCISFRTELRIRIFASLFSALTSILLFLRSQRMLYCAIQLISIRTASKF